MSKRRRSPTLALAFLLFLLFLLAGQGATPLPAAGTQGPAPFAPSGPTSPQEMEAFLDAFFGARMAESHIPGAAIVVVPGPRPS